MEKKASSESSSVASSESSSVTKISSKSETSPCSLWVDEISCPSEELLNKIIFGSENFGYYYDDDEDGLRRNFMIATLIILDLIPDDKKVELDEFRKQIRDDDEAFETFEAC